MKSNAEAQSSNFDGVKWGLVVLLVSVAVAGNLYFKEYSPLYRVLGVLVVAAIAGFVALKTDKGRRFIDMAAESRTEIRKVVWPTRQETTQTTLIVLAAVLFMGLVLWGIDTLLGWLVSMVVN
ncbi:preprotein translocase subunit SecE [Oceanospirillum sanctuarii]|uniref:preprotein translocase subunit SecE n=1 Tax=Oceanospirillum sanctuarii TaxID=1434821 RepID=UPI000A3B07B7|nr:preprotein translocase subunit SecE [Oceanospirillum sanctuarii]